MVRRKLVWRYADLFLSVARNPAGPGYRTQGRLPTGIEKSAVVVNPISEQEIEQVRLAFPESRTSAIGETIGRRLFDSIFTGDVALLKALAINGLGRGQGLRLRFRSGASEVSHWPFELLHDSRDFLALRRRSPVVRYLGPPNPVKTVRLSGPLRILVVVASLPSHAPLEIEKEWEGIKAGLEPLAQKKRVEIKRLDNPTLEALAEALAGNTFHVLHFMGHGALASSGEGVLFFQGGGGEPAAVAGGALAFVLRSHPSMRLVVLNACEGACVGRNDRFSGVAQGLIRDEMPAVVAMQARIPDESAVLFASRFYREVAKGTPVDRAVTEARRTLYLKGGTKDLDWAIPVLFLGTTDGKLFTPPWPRWLWILLALLAALVVIVSMAPWKPHCPSPKAVDMEMVWIPAGKFLMDSGEKGKPPIEVLISKPFCMGATEVSQAQWEAVMGANTAKDMEPRGNDLPMGSVSYEEAHAFIRRLNVLEETEGYGLPTSEQWEYSASGKGESEGANCKDGDDYASIAPVGTFRNNDWGLYDMIGNVWEWVESSSPTYRGLASDFGPIQVEQKVRRGGAFDSAEEKCLASTRAPLDPDRNNKNTGFRIVREIP